MFAVATEIGVSLIKVDQNDVMFGLNKVWFSNKSVQAITVVRGNKILVA